MQMYHAYLFTTPFCSYIRIIYIVFTEIAYRELLSVDIRGVPIFERIKVEFVFNCGIFVIITQIII